MGLDGPPVTVVGFPAVFPHLLQIALPLLNFLEVALSSGYLLPSHTYPTTALLLPALDEIPNSIRYLQHMHDKINSFENLL